MAGWTEKDTRRRNMIAGHKGAMTKKKKIIKELLDVIESFGFTPSTSQEDYGKRLAILNKYRPAGREG